MVQQRWHYVVICFVCDDDIPKHIRKVRVGDHPDGTPRFRCYDCEAGSSRWLKSQEAKTNKSSHYEVFKRAANKKAKASRIKWAKFKKEKLEESKESSPCPSL